MHDPKSMTKDIDIQFGDVEEQEPEVRLRPDRNKHFAVVEVYAPQENELPVFVDLDAMREHRTTFWFRRRHRSDVKRFLRSWDDQPALAHRFRQAMSAIGAS